MNDGNANIEVAKAQIYVKWLKTLCNEERKAIYHILLQKKVLMENSKKGLVKMVASLFSIFHIQCIWKFFKDSGIGDMSYKMIVNCGCKRV